MSETGIETVHVPEPKNHLGMTRRDWDAINDEPTDGGEKRAWGAPWFDYQPDKKEVKETSASKKPGWGMLLLGMLIANRMKGHQKH
ncbi:MAG: hypothetical protein V4449_03510 [Patescibacteria group bacterium]